MLIIFHCHLVTVQPGVNCSRFIFCDIDCVHVCLSCLQIPGSISKGALRRGQGARRGSRPKRGAQWGPCPSTGVWMGTAEKVLDQEAQNKPAIKCLVCVTCCFTVTRSPVGPEGQKPRAPRGLSNSFFEVCLSSLNTWTAPQFGRTLSTNMAPLSL